MLETLPEMRQRHKQEVIDLVLHYAEKGLTQTEAAKILDVSCRNLNNIIARQGLTWPYKRRGRRANDRTSQDN
jgi:plasmid maintenance system antidote protein VapI